MESLSGFVSLLAGISLSLPLALGLSWLSIRGAFHLLPSAPRRHRVAPSSVFLMMSRWAEVHTKELPRVHQAGLHR